MEQANFLISGVGLDTVCENVLRADAVEPCVYPIANIYDFLNVVWCAEYALPEEFEALL